MCVCMAGEWEAHGEAKETGRLGSPRPHGEVRCRRQDTDSVLVQFRILQTIGLTHLGTAHISCTALGPGHYQHLLLPRKFGGGAALLCSALSSLSPSFHFLSFSGGRDPPLVPSEPCPGLAVSPLGTRILLPVGSWDHLSLLSISVMTLHKGVWALGPPLLYLNTLLTDTAFG